MIWYDMSYNKYKYNNEFIDKLKINLPLKFTKIEELINEFEQTNTFIFNRYKRIL